jgi:hypothetical protein
MWIESEVERSTRAPLPPVIRSQPCSDRLETLVRPRVLLSPIYRRITPRLWAAWFAGVGSALSFQTFVPTILSAEGYAIVKSFRYSVVIYGAVIPGYIPGYVLGGHVVECWRGNMQFCFRLLRSDCVELGSAFRGHP